MSAEPADRCAVDYLAENKTNGRRARARVAHRATGEQLVGDATVIDLPCHRDDVTQISRRISAPTRRHASPTSARPSARSREIVENVVGRFNMLRRR